MTNKWVSQKKFLAYFADNKKLNQFSLLSLTVTSKDNMAENGTEDGRWIEENDQNK